MLISNMGLFWKRDAVFWGRQNNAGRLLGRLKTMKKAQLVNFWRQIGVYALYADYRLVYIGQVRSQEEGFGKRLRRHAFEDELAGRWDSFSWFGIRAAEPKVKKEGDPIEPEPADPKKTCKIEELLNILEGVAIEVSEPPLNSQGGRFTKRAKIFIQERDAERLGPTQEESFLDIRQSIKEIRAHQ